MLRRRNPLAKALADSRCILEFPVRDARGQDALDLETLGGLVAHGGTVERLGDVFRVVAPHAAIDAFGCCHLLTGADFVTGARREADAGQIATRCEGFAILQYWARFPRRREKAPVDAVRRTFTQRLTAAFLERLELPEATRWAVAVALDDLSALSKCDRFGNSMMIVPFPTPDLAALAAGESGVWASGLRRGAERILRIAEKRGLPEGGMSDTVILTSVGSVDRLAWFPKLSPASFLGAPTPSTASSANVFVWATRDLQVLTLAVAPAHPLFAQQELMRTIWVEVCGG